MSRRRKRSKKKKKKGGEEEEVAWKKKRRKKEGSLTGNSWSFTRLATVSWIQVWTVVTNRFIKTGQSFSTFFFFLPPPLSMRPVLQPISLSFPISCSCYVLYSREPATLHAGSRIGKIYFSLCTRIYLALTWTSFFSNIILWNGSTQFLEKH